jgi:pimeloyl-ACP methyl ester carboxylesterase
MKKIKQIVAQLQTPGADLSPLPGSLLWQYICYSPKFPVRLQQQQLLDSAQAIKLKVNDIYFTQSQLSFSTFKWGTGKHKVILTHGWGSKAIDYSELILALQQAGDFEIIAFDVPGNGSSEGELSNLLLYVAAVKAVIINYGEPDVLIGHSLGAMGNIIALTELGITPAALISIAPLMRLKENFEQSLSAAGIPTTEQTAFLKSFQQLFGLSVLDFTFNTRYNFDSKLRHWLAYDENDHISPIEYLKDFLKDHPTIVTRNYADVGHEKMIRSATVIHDVVEQVKAVLN